VYSLENLGNPKHNERECTVTLKQNQPTDSGFKRLASSIHRLKLVVNNSFLTIELFVYN
jgi:hypothetical protein